MIRNNPGPSSYFRGRYAKYGMYQWNVKTYAPETEAEYESVRLWCLGDPVKIGTQSSNGNTRYGFDQLNEVIGRKVKASLEGRSGGWLAIHEELTEEELTKVDNYVASFMKAIPEFLKEERAYQDQCTFEENVTLGGSSEGE